MFPSTGGLYFKAEALSQQSEKTCIHRRVEMNCLILWSVIERNTEEELIKDYDAADSQMNNSSTTQHKHSSVFTLCI